MKNGKWLLGGLFVIIVLCIPAFTLYRTPKKNAPTELVDTARLTEDEQYDVALVQKKIDALNKPKIKETPPAQPTATSTPMAKPQKIPFSDYKRIFGTSVIIGDSMVEAMASYDCLYKQNLSYKRGCSVKYARALFQAAVSRRPKYIFIDFGINDMQSCNGNANLFKSNYKEQIDYLKNELPNTNIYINSLIPIQPHAISKDHNLSHYRSFNAALIKLCQEEKITYIDNVKLIKNRTYFYEQDGIHPKYQYYALWFQNMAAKAGLI